MVTSTRYILACLAILICNSEMAIAANELTREKAAAILSARFRAEDVVDRYEACVISFSMIPSGAVPRAKQELWAYMMGDNQLPALPNLRYQIGGLDKTRDGLRAGLIAEIRWYETKLQTYAGNSSYGAIPVLAPNVCQKIESKKTMFALADSSGASEPRGCDLCTIKTGTVRFGSVTGIRNSGDNKIVEYTLVVEPTDIGKRMRIAPRTEAKYALFTLYDDGWRMQIRQ